MSTLIRPFRVITDEGNYNDNFNIFVSRLCPQCQQLFSSPHIHTKSTADKKSTDKFLVMEYAKLLQENNPELIKKALDGMRKMSDDDLIMLIGFISRLNTEN